MTKEGAPTFLLGLGAQKAGTTWLHDYLASSSQVDFGFTKEYHIFDARELPQMAEEIPRLRKHFPTRRRSATHNLRMLKGLRRYWRRRAFYQNTDRYFDYFTSLLNRDGNMVTGDISPGYNGLSAATLTTIRESFAQRGVRVRSLLILRDPVERCWSAIRMAKRNNVGTPGSVLPDIDDEALLTTMLNAPLLNLMSDYASGLSAMEAAFPEEDCLVLLYEDLFTTETAHTLCKFLGIDLVTPNFGKMVNVTQKTQVISNEVQSKIAQHLTPSYHATMRIFSPDYVRERWPSTGHILA